MQNLTISHITSTGNSSLDKPVNTSHRVGKKNICYTHPDYVYKYGQAGSIAKNH